MIQDPAAAGKLAWQRHGAAAASATGFTIPENGGDHLAQARRRCRVAETRAKTARMCHVKPIHPGPSGPFGRAIRYIYATAPDHPEHQYGATAAPSPLSLAAAKSAFGGRLHSWYRSKGTGLRI